MLSLSTHTLQNYFGFDQFRKGQQEIIHSILSGQDTLAVMPTGGGKSICYQVPALLTKGCCLVVSPLIALMQDQVHQLQQRKIPAAALYTGIDYHVQEKTLKQCFDGEIKLLYLSPERI